MLEKIKNYLHPARRKAIYDAMMLLVPLAALTGYVTESQAVAVAGALAAIGSLIMAVLHSRGVRRYVYAGLTAVSGAVAAFGVVDAELLSAITAAVVALAGVLLAGANTQPEDEAA